jgi:hypothetical protein
LSLTRRGNVSRNSLLRVPPLTTVAGDTLALDDEQELFDALDS